MNRNRKMFMAAAFLIVAGGGIFQAHQVSQRRGQIAGLQQQQAPLIEQIRQSQREYGEATNRMASLLAASRSPGSNPDADEIRQLQAEVTRLKGAETEKAADPDAAAVAGWLDRVNQIKEYAARHPAETVPEFKYLTDREWLIVADRGVENINFGETMLNLKSQAITRFAQHVMPALKAYAEAHDGQFPENFGQLKGICEAADEDILQQRYEIKPAGILPASSVKDLDIKTERVIVGKEPIASNTADHIAIYADGVTYVW